MWVYTYEALKEELTLATDKWLWVISNLKKLYH